jgi:calmodulin
VLINSCLRYPFSTVLREAFDAFDKEKKGSIPTDIVGTILEMLGQKLSEEELEDVIDEFDSNESGEFEFEEFAKLAARYVEPEEDYDALRKELREAFMLYDKEGRYLV